MLLEEFIALDVTNTDTDEIITGNPTKWIPATPLEEAYIWKKALKAGVVGKLSPSVKAGEGARAPLVYDFLLPDSTAVEYLNGSLEALGLKPRTKKQWLKWVKFWTFNPLPDGPLSVKTKLPKIPRF